MNWIYNWNDLHYWQLKHGAVDEPIINKIIIVTITKSRIKTDKDHGVQQTFIFEVNW